MKINRATSDRSNYLQILSGIAKPPKHVYYSGELPAMRRPSVAIVGTRKPTPYGKEVTYKLSYDLASRGVIIVSGLALGIDGIAHTAALDAGGTTIAILANGLPSIYPASHRSLAERIIKQGGALISEQPPETSLRKYHFLQRNRIVSGLADAVIITEASGRSGTLNTAMYALEQGKDLLVVPGNITSPQSTGCNALLRQGAQPVTSADDIVELLNLAPNTPQQPQPLGETPEEMIIIDLIASGIRDGETLQVASNLSTTIFSSTLTMLEIKGVVRSLGGNQWTLR